MFVILGLGNPGREYAMTRHNIGFMTLDALASRHGIDIRRENFRSVFGEGRVGDERVVLAKPLTFMNNSGWAARDLVNWYKVEPRQLLVVYDDADIPLGTIRVREGGSSGSHNGMKSVIYQLGFDDFPRVRVGIGAPEGERDIVAHVLSKPSGEEMEKLRSAIFETADAVELIVAGRLAQAQARFNKRAHNGKKKEAGEEKPKDQDGGAPGRDDG
ncbi:MAG TPA: aminoacyl-tRNA hydrolase [Clostridia bacterium]|nr:MAG: Peptidyl-tRNA hydrolase [Firmicutes bacterium ADurb.Bin248]HOG00569.1 aminoacyl-tRNA hydrolase [Clostridia bacterium]HOS18387.1 aminoacyl-tRNA hydrolase [Clostridia bacterium]HPK14768.1 aminoacyl-tRNA hydrolase [Clostridia bacterium]